MNILQLRAACDVLIAKGKGAAQVLVNIDTEWEHYAVADALTPLTYYPIAHSAEEFSTEPAQIFIPEPITLPFPARHGVFLQHFWGK